MKSMNTIRLLVTTTLALAIFITINVVSIASSNKTEIAGKVYEFDEDNDYEFSSENESHSANKENTYGSFSVLGNISESSSKNGIPSYQIDNGNMKLFYSYDDKFLKAAEDDWHLVADDSEKVDLINLDDEIEKGAIIIQTSKDNKNWITETQKLNMFENNPNNSSPIYTTTEIQQINGGYYRVIVAYMLARRTSENNFLFINLDKYEYKRVVEVYSFFAENKKTEQDVKSADSYNLGSVVKTKSFDGYSGEQTIESNDPHYNITIGQFFVNGYTSCVDDKSSNKVFLKNVGDKVALWFKLKENIDAIDNNKKVFVSRDSNGSDLYFQTKPTDFGRGTLIIRYTDYNNVPQEPQIYTNYLEANASISADTKVELCEEGDYEVALDYELTEDKLIDQKSHYRIFFKFSVRNGNCMAYTFDLKTGDELSSNAMTENGFRIDLAKSRYLDVMLKKEVLTDSADGIVEDTRFNGPARDGAKYTEEGIYTITVKNKYTGQQTEKKIYVGTNSILIAHMSTGLSIEEINKLIKEGATINSDGTITYPVIEYDPTESETIYTTESIEPQETTEEADNDEKAEEDSFNSLILIIIIVIIVAAIVFVVLKKKPQKTADIPKISEIIDVDSFEQTGLEGKTESNSGNSEKEKGEELE